MALMSQVGLEFVARNRAAATMSQFDRSISRLSGNLLRMIGLAGGIYGIQRAISSITQAYIVQEKAERDLAAAIRITDDNYKSIVATLKRYAINLQSQTIYGDEAILSQIAYAKNLGVTTDKLEAAAKAAIGLAAKYRIDLQSAMMLIGRASQGQTQTLTRYGIVLDENLTVQEKFNELLRLGADAFGLAREEAQTLSGRLQQQKNRWGDLKEAIAGEGGVVAAYTDLLDTIDRNRDKWSWFFKTQISGLAEVTSGFKGLRTVINETISPHSVFQQGTAPVRSARENQAIVERRAAQRWSPLVQRILADNRQFLDGLPKPSEEIIVTAEEKARAAAKAAAERERAIIDQAQRTAHFVRQQDYMTRQERLQYLRDYVAANAVALGEVEDANRILHDEITMLERARLDQMRVYYAEIRERSQDAYLVAMEYSATYARQVQDDFVHLWDPFIDGTKSAKEAMLDFFRDMLLNLAKAQAQMAMMRLWDRAIGPIFGGVSQTLFGIPATLLHQGGLVGEVAASRIVPAAAFAGAPRLHEGLGADEFPAILQRGERVIPANAGGLYIQNYIARVDATDAASFEGQLYRSRHAIGDINIMLNRGNHPSRRTTE